MNTRRPRFLLCLLVALAACEYPVQKNGGGGGGGGHLPTDEVAPPTVIATVPASGSNGIEVDAPILVEFSERMEASTVSLTLSPSAVVAAPDFKNDTLASFSVSGRRIGSTKGIWPHGWLPLTAR